MRLWAATNTIHFDDLAPHLGCPVDLSFGITLSFINELIRPSHGWPVHLDSFSNTEIRQCPELERTFCTLTGTLRKHEGPRTQYLIESYMTMVVWTTYHESWIKTMDKVLKGRDSTLIEATGSLHFGRASKNPNARGIVHRFESFCLDCDDPRFGRWFEVDSYRDVSADPDVIAAPVLLGEVELIP